MNTPRRSWAWTSVAAALAAIAGALVLALATSLPTGDASAQTALKKPTKAQAAKKDDPWPINDDVDDPAVWGKAFPLHYELYKKSVDMQRTKHGGSEIVKEIST